MIPKVRFKYVSFYDYILYNFSTGKEGKRDLFLKRRMYCERRIKELNHWWDEEGNSILNKLQKASGIKWSIHEIPIYVLEEPHRISQWSGFSDPLTIFFKLNDKKVKHERNLKEMQALIIHELTHKNLNCAKQIEKYVHKLMQDYKCTVRTASHVLVYAVMKELTKYYRVEVNKKTCRDRKDYLLAWEIVEKEGPDKFIKGLQRYA